MKENPYRAPVDNQEPNESVHTDENQSGEYQPYQPTIYDTIPVLIVLLVGCLLAFAALLAKMLF